MSNRTVSREHLVLTRKNERVRVEIRGRNGVNLDDKQYLDQTIECLPPTSFKIGSVWCHLDLDAQDDSTVFINAVSNGVYGTQSWISPSAAAFIEEHQDLSVGKYERPETGRSKYVIERDSSSPVEEEYSNINPAPEEIVRERDHHRDSGDSVGLPFYSAHKAFKG